MTIRFCFRLGTELGVLFFTFIPAALSQQTKVPVAPRALPTEVKAWKGNFDGMVEHVAYKLAPDIEQAQRKAREQITSGKK